MEPAQRCASRPLSVKLALVFTLSFGALYALVQPPFAASEEREHMTLLAELAALKLWSPADTDGAHHMVDPVLVQLAEGYEAVVGNGRARITLDDLKTDLRARSDGASPLRVPAQTASVGRLSDLPLVPGYLLGRLFGLSMLAQLYLARLSGVVCFALLASWASVQAGRLSWAFFALATLPVALMQAGGVSGEALSHGLALVFFALIARGAHTPEAHGLDARARLLALASFTGLVICQPPMLAASVCFLALPADAPVRALLRGRRLFLLALLSGGLALLLWLHTDAQPLLTGANAAQREQLQFVATHPIRALLGLARSLLVDVDALLLEGSAFAAPLANIARFSGGVIALFAGELLLLLSLGVNRDAAPTASSARARRSWLIASLVGYALATSLLALLNQGDPPATRLQALPTRSLALMAPALLLALSLTSRPGFARFLWARPRTRVVSPLLLINALALATLVGRYFIAAKHRWPY